VYIDLSYREETRRETRDIYKESSDKSSGILVPPFATLVTRYTTLQSIPRNSLFIGASWIIVACEETLGYHGESCYSALALFE